MEQKPSYEEKYHRDCHRYLIDNEKYYHLRAQVAIEKYFEAEDMTKEVLEFGAGEGQNIFLLKNRAAFDISSFAREFLAKKGVPCYSCIDDIPDKNFDIVLCCHVLEHLDDPLETLRIFKRKLKPGGKLILVVPRERHAPASFEMDINQHLFSWNFRTLNNLLNRAGYTVCENAICRGKGYYKLMPLTLFGYKPWRLATKLVAFLFRSSEMKVVAIHTQTESGDNDLESK